MRRIVAVTVALAVAAAAFLAVAVVVLNPISMEVSFLPSGGFTIRGGHYSGALLDYLQHGPRQPETPAFVVARDAFPTLRLQEDSFKLTTASLTPQVSYRDIRPADFLRSFAEIGDFILTLAKGIVTLPFAIFTMNGAATCGSGGGSCFYIGGTGNFSSTAHWSASSGGASCTCTPAATDSVTFDASSGAGTATQDNATFTSGVVTLTNSSVTVSGSSNLWKVGGNWSDANRKFSGATSTIEFTSGATIIGQDSCISPNGPGGYAADFYNMIVDLGATVTSSTNAVSVATANVLTVNGTLTTSNSSCIAAYGTGASLVVGGSGSVSGADFIFEPNGNATIPAATYHSLIIFGGYFGAHSLSLGGAVTTTGNWVWAGTCTGSFCLSSGASASTLSTGGFALTAQGTGGIVLVTGSSMSILSGASSVSVSGPVTVSNASAYITSSAGGSWTVSGAWTNNSTSASWSFAAPIMFGYLSGGGSSQTMKFCGNLCGSGVEFVGSVQFFDNSATIAITFTLSTRGLYAGSGVVINGGTCLNTSNLPLSVGGGIDVGYGFPGCLIAGSSVVTALQVLVDPDTAQYNYITSSLAGSWTIGGTNAVGGYVWSDMSTDSSQWSFSAPITFSSSTNPMTVQFAGSNLNPEFSGPVTFDSLNAAGETYTLINYNLIHTTPGNLVASSSVIVQNTAPGASGPTVLDTSSNNYAVTAASFAIAALGQIVGHSSILTANGNVTGLGSISGGTLTFAANATWSLATAGAVSVNGSKTVTLGANVSATAITVGGALAISTNTVSFTSLTVNPPGALSSPTATSTASVSIVTASGVFTLSAFIVYNLTTAPSIRFAGSDTVASDNVTFSFGGIPSGSSIQLIEDGLLVSTSSVPTTGMFSFAIGAWSTHTVELYWSSSGTTSNLTYMTAFGALEVPDRDNPAWGATVAFTFNGRYPVDSPPTKFSWDFGDGIVAMGNPVTHHFSFAFLGTFSVRLLACSDTKCGGATESFTFMSSGAIIFALVLLGTFIASAAVYRLMDGPPILDRLLH